ncbi:MAG: hypothetical protein RIF41_37200 [Polyangiaceae bacterium]
MVCRWLVPIVVATLAVAPEVGWAQGPRAGETATGKSREAAQLEAKARAAFDQGQFEAAAGHFARAHELSPAAITKYNEAFSWEKAHRDPEQADAYEAALAIGTLDAERTAYARERLVELEKTLGVLVVRQPDGARVYVAHAQGRPVPARIHLLAGDHDVVVRTGARTHRESLTVQAQEVRFLAFDPDPGGRVENSGNGTPSAQAILGWTSVGIGGAFAIATVGLGGAFLSARSDFIEGGQTNPDARQRAVDLRLATNLSLAGALVFGGLGLTLVLTAPDDPGPKPTAAARVRVLPGGVVGELTW